MSCSTVCNPQYRTVCSDEQRNTCSSNTDAELSALVGQMSSGSIISAAKVQKLYTRTRAVAYDRGWADNLWENGLTPEPTERANYVNDATGSYSVDEGGYIHGILFHLALTKFKFHSVTKTTGNTIVLPEGTVQVYSSGLFKFWAKHGYSGTSAPIYYYWNTTGPAPDYVVTEHSSSFTVWVRNLISPLDSVISSHPKAIKIFIDSLNIRADLNTGTGYNVGQIAYGSNMATLVYAVQAMSTTCHCVSDCVQESFCPCYCNCHY